MIYKKQSSTPILGIMNSWWCHSGYVTLPQSSRVLWMSYSSHIWGSLYFCSLRIFLSIQKNRSIIYWTYESHLNTLQEHEFYVKTSKCTFDKTTVEYLGHIISKEGVQIDEIKIRAVQGWPWPRTITKLRGFLGLTRYYRKFVKNYGTFTQSLTKMIKKEVSNGMSRESKHSNNWKRQWPHHPY